MGWIGSFLSGRSQKVVLEGKSSSSFPVLSDVPQGSVLVPLLFLIYINDFPEDVSNSTVRFFADDTLLYLPIHNSSDCTKLQEDLNNLQRWESDWQMYFHQELCEVIHITTNKKAVIHSMAILSLQCPKSNTLTYTSPKTLSGILTSTPSPQRQIRL